MTNLYRSIFALFIMSLLAACNGAGVATTKAITSYTLAGVPGNINEASKTITVTLPYATNVSALIATFNTTGKSVNIGSTPQISGTTANDFSKLVVYTVTAADGTTANYTVYIASGASIGGTIFGMATGSNIILQNNSTDNLSISANGSFTFASTVTKDNTYAVSVFQTSSSQSCAVTYGSGTASTFNIGNVNVLCGPTLIGNFVFATS